MFSKLFELSSDIFALSTTDTPPIVFESFVSLKSELTTSGSSSVWVAKSWLESIQKAKSDCVKNLDFIVFP
jgi:hypothetical protein